jgi:hypothetical protein
MFGVVMAFNTLLFVALHAYILRRLIKPELADAQDPHHLEIPCRSCLLFDWCGGRLARRPCRFLGLFTYPAIFYSATDEA